MSATPPAKLVISKFGFWIWSAPKWSVVLPDIKLI
jgi:hypothetical protein